MVEQTSHRPELGPSSRLRRLGPWLARVTLAAAMLLPLTGARADDFKLGSITVEHPWSRATPGGAQVGAGYLTITNGAKTEDRLVSATAEIAGRTEIHDMSMVDGVMKMRHVAEGLPVPAEGSLALKPGAYHLMFLDLKRPLKDGETFSGTLTFEKAGTLDVTFDVEGAGGKAHEHHP